MAKTRGPLLSQEAHGSIAKIITYSKRRSGSQVRKYNKPLRDPSGAQRGQRRLTEFLVAQWQNMSAGEKAAWETNAKASGLNLAGYHYFLRSAQRDLSTHHGLCGYWHCNEIVNGQVLDLSGKGNHGTLEPDYPSDAPVLTNSDKTRFGKGILFDGVNDYVNCGVDDSLNITDRLTFETWFRLDDKTKRCRLISRLFFRAGNDSGGYYLDYRADTTPKKLQFVTLNNGVTDIDFDYETEDEWLDIYCVYDGTDNIIYINGEEEDRKASGGIRNSPGDNFLLSAGGNIIKGAEDEVCVYNRALSAAEIATRYKFAIAKV